MSTTLISSSQGVLAVLASVVMVSFYLVQKFPKVFKYLPAIIFIYITPMILTNLGILPAKSEIYTVLKQYALPMFIVIMLLEIDIRSTFKIAGHAVGVMMFAVFGVVLGAVLAFIIFKNYLPQESWKIFSALTGTWVGGTGNMAAVGVGLDISGEGMGLAILVDTLVAVVWIPLLMVLKNFNSKMPKFLKIKDKSILVDESVAKTAKEYHSEKPKMSYTHFVYLLAISFLVIWVSDALAHQLPVIKPVLSTNTWKVLIITTISILLSLTPAQKIPGTRSVATGIIYIFVASMGATAMLTGIESIPVILIAGLLINILHLIFTILGAYLFKADISVVAISSAACHGGAASAPVVASFYSEKLVPVAIVLALVGYALGNYMGFIVAKLTHLFI